MENRYSNFDLVRDMVTSGQHRGFIGGMWDEIGKLQFDFLKQKGLIPEHRLLDVGCGSLRGGVHFIPYLNPYNYYGFDLNMVLIKAGLEIEIGNMSLSHKVDVQNFSAASAFVYPHHWPEMDMALALSLLTHLNYNSLCECLKKTSNVLKLGGRFYATIFEVPEAKADYPFKQSVGIVSHPFKDPYHYTRALIKQAASDSGLVLIDIEEFGHPRNQKMAIFERS